MKTTLYQINDGDLDVANQASDRSLVRVQVSASEAKSGIPRVSSGAIARTQVGDHCLSSSCSILGGLVGTTDIGELVVDAVGNDGWVESLLLALVAERVLGLEGEFGGGAVVEPGFEFHGGDAESEVQAGDGRGYEAAEVASDGVSDGARTDAGCCAEEGAA